MGREGDADIDVTFYKVSPELEKTVRCEMVEIGGSNYTYDVLDVESDQFEFNRILEYVEKEYGWLGRYQIAMPRVINVKYFPIKDPHFETISRL